MKITKQDLKIVYKQSTLKDGESEGFFNVFIFRKISIYFSWVFASLGISPNAITILSFIINIIVAYLFFTGIYLNYILGLVLFTLALILDMSDGEVARLTNKMTKVGAFLDPFLDRLAFFLLMGAIAHGHFINSGDFTVVYLYCSYLIIAYLSLIVNHKAQQIAGEKTVDNIRKISSFIRNKDFKKYIKWDGGFACVFLAIFVILNKLFLYILIILAIDFFLLLFTYRSLILRLKKNNE